MNISDFKVGTKFWVNTKRYGIKEVLTVTEIGDDILYCETTRYPGALQIFPGTAVRAYGDQIQLFKNWERDFERATRIIENGVVGTVAADFTDEQRVVG